VSGRIDVHGHLGAYGPFHVPAGDVDALVRRMDALGVERLLLSHHAAFSSDYHWGNAAAAAAAERQAGRIFFYAVANPNYPEETEAELDRLSSRPGFVGVKFHPDTHQQALEGQGYASALAWAARRGCPVLVHFWLGSRHNDVGNVRAVAARHPGVRFILAHLGGPAENSVVLAGLANEHRNLWFDTCGSRHVRDCIRLLVDRGLGERLLYGSDMPFIDPAGQLGKVCFADIPAATRSAILGGNARRLFGWTA
jgi:uncharacterized protein